MVTAAHGTGTAAWLGLAAVLVLSGAGKLPRPRAAVPQRFLASGGVMVSLTSIRAAALTEVGLGAGLLTATGRPALLVAGAVAVMLAGYTGFVVALHRRGATLGCGCHGQDGDELTGWTFARNGALLAVAAWVCLTARHGGFEAYAQLPPHAGPAFAGLLVAGSAVAGLIAHRRGRARVPGPTEQPVVITPRQADPHDYVSWPIPDAPIRDGAGSRLSLRDLPLTGAVVLILIDPTSRQFVPVARWRERLGHSEALTGAVLTVGPELGSGAALLPTYADHTGAARAMLGASELPAAVLLGADGWLAGGPTRAGATAIDEFLDLVLAELADADL